MKKIINITLIIYLQLIFNIAYSNTRDSENRIVNDTGNITSSEIAQEIEILEKNDQCIKEYLSLNNANIRKSSDKIQRSQIIKNTNHKDFIKKDFINNTNFNLKNLEEEFTNVTEQQIPKLYSVVKDLAEKANIAIPYIFISFDKEVYNVFATVYSKNLSGMIFSAKLL